VLKYTPKQLGFPYPSWHPGQEQAMEWLLDNYQDTHVMLLDAPTASGKSAIAKAIEQLTGEWVYDATWSRKLQKQYTEEFHVPNIMGRGNFECKPGAEHGAEFCDLRFCDDDDPARGYPGELAPHCPFIQQFNAGTAAPFAVLNYLVLFNYLGHPKRPLPRREWLVCDEGHMLEDAIGQYVDVYLDRVWFEKIGFPVELPIDGKVKANILDWSEAAGEVETMREDKKTQLAWNEAKRMAAQAANKIAKGFIVDDDGLVISIRCLWPLEQARELFIDFFPHVLVMSATIGDMDALARAMGLPKDSYKKLSVPSCIPVGQRPIYIEPISSLSYNAEPVDYERMADAIIDWAQNQFPSEKGLVHVSSYMMAKRLGRLLATRGLGNRVVIQDRRDPKIQEYWERTSGTILCSPVAGLGLDLPYLFGWQVIAKLAYPSLSDKIVRMRKDIDINWYLRQTANKTVQMAGRVCRTPTDEGITIIADSSFKNNVWRRARNSFPGWFAEALRWPQ